MSAKVLTEKQMSWKIKHAFSPSLMKDLKKMHCFDLRFWFCFSSASSMPGEKLIDSKIPRLKLTIKDGQEKEEKKKSIKGKIIIKVSLEYASREQFQ